MPNEFIIKNGLIVESGTTIITGSLTVITGSAVELQVTNTGVNIGSAIGDIHSITGSLRVSGSITGSLFGTASFALSSAGGLTNFIEGFSSATQATSFLSASNAASTVNISIDPKGSGSILAAVPDGTAVGGNARGIFAIDFQLTRSLATQVASGNYSVIAGGANNTAGIENATIAGGISNQAYALCTIGGGFNNTASTATPSVTGSVTLTAGSTSLPGAYISSTLTATNMLIRGVGIPDNTYISSTAPPSLLMSNPATVSGAQTLSYYYTGNTIAGGRSNNAAGMYTTIGGGFGNTVSGNNTGVAAGSSNSAGGTNSFVGGGLSNTAGGNYDVVCGGQSNSVTDTNNGSHRFVGAGSSNTMGQQCLYSIIVGGETNSIFGRNNFIGGGGSNVITSAVYSVMTGGTNHSMTGGNTRMTIGGGQSNTVSNNYGTIAGGQSNTVSGTHAIIGGGQANIVTGAHSFIGGGQNNRVTAPYSVVVGGLLNTASVDYSFAAGRRAKASHSGSFVWADSTDADYSSNGNDTFNVRAIGGSFFTGSMTVTGSLIVAPASTVELQVTSTGVKIGNAIGDIHSVTGSLRVSGSITGSFLYVNDNIGVGTSTPGYPIEVNGSTTGISIYASDDIVAFSDAIVKGDIQVIENAIEKIKEIRGVTFIRTDKEDSKRHAGVIAQEVQKVLPEVVTTREDNGTLAVAYGNLNALLIEAIKEQQKQIEELKAEIDKLKNK